MSDFKVGDKVVIVNRFSSLNGNEGVIATVFPQYVNIVLDEYANEGPLAFGNDSVRLIPPSEKWKDEIRVTREAYKGVKRRFPNYSLIPVVDRLLAQLDKMEGKK